MSYARYGVTIAFEAIVLATTLFKTIRLKQEAVALGIHSNFTTLLLQNGWPYIFGLLRKPLPDNLI